MEAGAHHSHHVNIDISKKKKVSLKKILIVLGVIAVLVAVFFAVRALTGKGTVSSRTIEYTIKLENGTIIAENVSNFTSGKFASYFGLASKSVDEAINSLKKGQSTSITLDAKDAFGEYDESLVIVQNRTQTIPRASEINRTIEVPLASVTQAFGENPAEGKTYNITGAPFGYKVLKIKDDVVTLSQEAEAGAFIPVDQVVFANITKVTDDKIGILYSAEEQTINISIGNISVTMDDENIYFTTNPALGRIDAAGVTVLSFNKTSIVIDTNAPYAGEKVIIEAKVVDIIKKAAAKSSASSIKKVEGAPTLEAFVVSYCPYGLQMQRILVPVAKALNGKANVIVRYIGEVSGGKIVSMHGEQEAQENLRQICIREEQSDKFWSYIECFIKAGDSESCIKDAGVDEKKLAACASGPGIDYAQADFNLDYDIQGSPTLILNGESASEFEFGGRNANAVKDMICSAFDTPPEECSQELEAAESATSFSEDYSSGSAASAASCG
jgi:FKBP-type peptidyl-prolyl cis-trans isomerase 2